MTQVSNHAKSEYSTWATLALERRQSCLDGSLDALLLLTEQAEVRSKDVRALNLDRVQMLGITKFMLW